MNSDINNWDPYSAPGGVLIYNAYIEKLYADNWTLNPSVFNYEINFRPAEYVSGNLAESWEFTDQQTYVVHLRHGIKWQDIAPMNGREFVASDVVFHYDRTFGLGEGYTKPPPLHATDPEALYLASVTADGDYTVVFKWKTANQEFILETIHAIGSGGDIEAPEAVKAWGDLNDWHHAIGTGPFILQDYVSGSSATLVKNPNYWAHDERYPQNQLPYVASVKFLIMPDNATALAAMRSGKIDILNSVPYASVQPMQKTNPEILVLTTPSPTTDTVVPRNDKAPFTDIKVREAMQLAINLPEIAQNIYGGVADPWPSSITSNYMTGWGFPYNEWPQDLKDQYAYNPTEAKALLTAAGFPNGFTTDIITDTADPPDLMLVVQSYFAAVNIKMEIRPMDTASFTSFARMGYHHDQMAYDKAGDPLGFTYEPIRQIQRFTTGKAGNYAMTADPTFDAFYTQAMAATTVDQVKQIIKDANEYAAEKHWVISLLQPPQYILCQPWLKGYSGQIIAPATSPVLFFFYGSRFWIDKN